jgi:hypothetical protein
MSQLATQKALVVVLAAAVLGVAVFIAFSRGDTLGEMKVRAEGGTVTIQRGEETLTTTDEEDIAPGDVIATGEDSQAELRLQGDRRLFLGSFARIRILGPGGVESQDGSIVADTEDPLKVSMGDTIARARGRRTIFRVDRDSGATRAGVYRGVIDLAAPGSTGLELDALWQTTVVADRLYRAEPYRLRQQDSLDQLFLDDLVELEGILQTNRDGYIGEIAGTAPTLAYFDSLVKGDVGFLRDYAGKLSPKRPAYTADVMIGLFLAKSAPGSLHRSFDETFGYFEQGASWGVTAGLLGLDKKVEWNPAVAQLEDALFESSGGAGGGDDPTFAIAGEETGSEESTVDGPSADDGTFTDPGDSGSDPAPPPPDSDDDDGDGDDGGGGDDDPKPPPPCDLECEVEKIIPSPDPDNLLDPPPLGD